MLQPFQPAERPRPTAVEAPRVRFPVCWVAAFFVAIAAAVAGAPGELGDPGRRQISFDSGWRFTRGDPTAAATPDFNDATWRTVIVPHDWSIEGPFDEQNPAGGAGGFLPAGVGWYRNHFTLPITEAQRRIFIEFDGVMANSDVWINGFHLGKRPNGYVGFRYDLTGHLGFGALKMNIVAVRADNSGQPASRWYAGAGIYRHVRLLLTTPVRIDQWGVFVTTTNVSPVEATVRIRTTVINQSEIAREVGVQGSLETPDGKSLDLVEAKLQTIPPGGTREFHQEASVRNPRLWDLGHPNLYRCIAQVRSAGVTVDQESTTFGIRDARFEADTGFWLNGRNLKLKGVCLHHDAGGLGAAVPLRAWERRLELLKGVGCNAIRTAHHPFAPEFLDLCDRMGFLVMDEQFDCWTVAKNRHDYHLYFNEWSQTDVRDIVRRDRNHPAIVVYSAGNEIRDTPQSELAKKILRGLIQGFHENDPTRPVSQALFRPNVSHDYDNGFADLLDVIGQNYREDELRAAHEAKPSRKILGTENGHDRRVWLALRDNPACAGQFLWTGIDYLGESRRWPVVGSASGLFDRTGTARPRAFERQSWWSDQPMVHIARRLESVKATPSDPGFQPLNRRDTHASDWTPRNLEPHEETVEVFSNCDQVELTLNGKSLGSQSLPADASPRVWKVPFSPGVITAAGKQGGAPVVSHELRTAGKPARISLTAERATITPGWDDVDYVKVLIVDAEGLPIPDADDLVSFNLTGPGEIAAVDSGDSSSHEPFQVNERHAYRGVCFAIVRASAPAGQIKVTASAPGLRSASVEIRVTPTQP